MNKKERGAGVLLNNLAPPKTIVPEPTVSELRDEDLKEAVVKLLDRIDYLEEQLQQTTERIPSMFVGEENDYNPREVMSNLESGMEDGLAAQMYFGTDSHKIPEMILRNFGPKFKKNSRVRVNPDANVHGSDKKWGELLRSSGSAGTGTVIQVSHLTDSGTWKYIVRVPGLTDKRGTGLMETELLPIRQKVTKYVIEDSTETD